MRSITVLKFIFFYLLLILTFGSFLIHTEINQLSSHERKRTRSELDNRFKETPKMKKMTAFKKSIKEIIIDFSKMGVTKIPINDKEYSWERLTLTPPSLSLIRKMDINQKKFIFMSLEAQRELKLLYDHKITRSKLFEIYKSKLDPFLEIIKFILEDFAKLKIGRVIIGEFVFVNISSLTANLDKKGSKQIGIAKDKLFALYKYNSDASIVKSKLDAFLAIKRETFRESIETVINKLGTMKITRIHVDGKNYLLKELLQANNIGKQYSKMSSQAQTEFRLLHENGITKKKLFKLYKNELESKITPLLSTKWEVFRQSIKDIISDLKQIGIIDIHVETKKYSWGHLTNKISSIVITDINKKYASMSLQSQEEFILLYNNGITHQKLFKLYKSKLDPFLKIIKPTLEVFARFKKPKVTKVTIDGEPYLIDELTQTLTTTGSEQVVDGKTQLINLYMQNYWDSDYVADASVMKGKLDAFLAIERETFRESIKDIISDLKQIGIIGIQIDEENYLWKNLTHNSSLAKITDINKKYEKMSIPSQAEFRLLHENGISKEKLFKLYKDKLDFSFKNIKPTLQLFDNLDIKEFTINGATYLIRNLLKHLDTDGSKLTNHAKKEFIMLLSNFNNQNFLEVYKDVYLGHIRSILGNLFLVKITEINVDGTIYQVKDLTKNDPNIFATPFSELSLPAREELTKLATDKITKEKLFNATLDAYLMTIRPILKLFAEIKKTELKIIADQDNFIIGDLTATLGMPGSQQRGDAKNVLVSLLLSSDTHGDISFARLTTIYEDLLDTFLEKDKSTLQLFAALNITEVTIGKKVYPISNLNAHLDKTGTKQTGAAKHEFIKLLIDNINKEKLTTNYNDKLNFFLATIKPSLQEFLLAKITEVIIDGKSYLIGDLTASLWTDDATQISDAQTELLALLKYSLDSPTVKNKLDAFLTKARSTFKQIIQPNLQAFAHAKINKAQIGDQVYSLKALINVNNINKGYANMTELAKTEFTKLWAAKINNTQLTTALENVLMEKYNLQIQNFFNTFDSYGITQVKIEDKFYLLDKLLTASVLEQSIYLISSGARVQLQTLFVDGISTVLLFQILVDTKRILTFQKNWDGNKVSSYLLWLPVFDIKKVKLSQNKTFPVDALAVVIDSMLTAEKFDFTKLQGKARKQLLDLLNNQEKIREEKTFQDDVWKQIKNHQKWKAIEGPIGKIILQSMKNLLLEIQDLGISKVSHSFFPEDYDLSFLKNSANWKQVSFKNLLQGMKVVVNGINVEFYSHLFPNQIIFQVPMKKLSTVFSIMTISSIKKSLKEAIDTKLDSYKTDIQPSLKAYGQAKVNQFRIGEQAYQIDYLVKLTNLNLSASELSQDAKTQLKVLAMVPITAQQLDEILIKILVSKKQKLKSVQDFNFKPLIIGFTVTVAALVAFSVICASFYWFFKIKK